MIFDLGPARLRRWALEAALFIAVVVGVQLYQSRGLPAGAAPPLERVRTDGAVTTLAMGQRVGAGGAATLVDFWATWGLKARLWWAENFKA